MAEFNMDEYYSKGEKLYSEMATGADVFDPKYPDVSMFNKEGQWSQDYLSASGKDVSGERYTGGATPRSTHFLMEKGKLLKTIPKDERSTSMMVELRYGKKPRYSKTDNGYKLTSPYSLEKEYRSRPKDLGLRERMDFDSDFREKIESMPTDTTSIERKVMDSMLKEDKVPWQDIEDPVARLKAKYKSR